MGNLYRTGKFLELFCPYGFWDYDTCSGSSSKDVTWGALFEQQLSACASDGDFSKYGLNAGIGRGGQSTIVAQIGGTGSGTEVTIDHAYAVRPPSPEIL